MGDVRWTVGRLEEIDPLILDNFSILHCYFLLAFVRKFLIFTFISDAHFSKFNELCSKKVGDFRWTERPSFKIGDFRGTWGSGASKHIAISEVKFVTSSPNQGRIKIQIECLKPMTQGTYLSFLRYMTWCLL